MSIHVKINPKYLEAHFLSLPFANINYHKMTYYIFPFFRFSECMKKLCNAQFFIENFEKKCTLEFLKNSTVSGKTSLYN